MEGHLMGAIVTLRSLAVALFATTVAVGDSTVAASRESRRRFIECAASLFREARLRWLFRTMFFAAKSRRI
jgi:hypothetical protein